jgi:hypothetical protein
MAFLILSQNPDRTTNKDETGNTMKTVWESVNMHIRGHDMHQISTPQPSHQVKFRA